MNPTLRRIILATVLAVVVLVDSLVHWHRQMSENAMRELEAELDAAQ